MIGLALDLKRHVGNVPGGKTSCRVTRMIGWAGTNSLAEGRNGRGLVVLDVEEAVQLGDLEQVVDPLAEVHQL